MIYYLKTIDLLLKINLSGRVQEWTDLPDAGDPDIQLHPVAPQASAV